MKTLTHAANIIVTDLPDDMLGFHLIGYQKIKTDIDGAIVVGILLTKVNMPNGVEIEISKY